MAPVDIANFLEIKLEFPIGYNIEDKSKTEQLHQIKRKIRYIAYAAKKMEDGESSNVIVPDSFRAHYESLDGFEGWKGFAKVWDVKKTNPLEIYYRDFSVAEEWEATIRRVVPELAVDRLHRQRTE